MRVFLIEWLFVAAMLVGFGAVGGFAVVPFRNVLPFAVLASPLAGLLVMALGMGLAYNVVGLPFAIGVIGTAVAGVLATAVAFRGARSRPCWRSLLFPGGMAIVVASVFVAIAASATIEVGGPALHYWTGTDHLGYAHPADWIIAHPPWDRPRVDPAVPYESWPALMLEADPRFGSYATVALVAVIRGIPGAFAYDITCAIVLSASVLGVAAVFSRSRLTLGLLVVGLLTCHWYDYSRTGYLGRMMGYPAGCMVVGLLLAARSPLRPGSLVPILLVAAGTATVYVADATSLFIGVIGGTFVVASVALCREPLGRRLRCLPWQHVVVLGLIFVVALSAKNTVARRWSSEAGQGGALRTTITSLVDPTVGTELLSRPWEEVRPTLLDLEQAHAPIGMLPRDLLDGAILLARAAWLALIVIAVIRRDPAALALTLGPLLLLTLLNALPSPFARWVTAQLPGTFYPFMLGAGALLLDGATIGAGRTLVGRALSAGLVALLVISVGLRLPRFVGAVDRYVGAGTRTLPPFSLAEMDGLAEAIGDQTVRIDVEEPHLVLISLVDLGRRGIEIQWGPRAWFHVASYRGWPASEATRPAQLILESVDEPAGSRATVLYQTRQFRLIHAEDARLP